MNTINAVNKLRLTGMATGMDTDGAIKQMMTRYYARVDKEKQRQQTLAWRQEGYRDMIGQVNSLKTKYFDVLSKDYLLSENNFSTFEVTQTGTISNAITAKASSGALEGSYSVEVTSANIATKASLDPTANVNIKEATLGLDFPLVIKHVDGTNFNDSLVIEGKTINITSGTYKNLSELASQINKDMSSVDLGGGKNLSDNVKAVVKDGNIKFLKKVTIDDTNNNLTIDVDGTTQNITIDNGSYTLEELASKLNGKLSGGYTAQSTDGLNITFTNADKAPVAGTAKFSDNSEIKFDSKVTVSRTGADNDEFSNPTINEDTVSYDKRIISGVNDTLTFNVFDGTGGASVPTTINLTAGTHDMSSLVTEINNKLGAGSSITVSESVNGKMLFKSTTSDQITLTGNAASTLGVASGFKIDQKISDKMANLINDAGKDRVEFTINGKNYCYDFTSTSDTTVGDKTYIGAKDKSISDILNDIEKGSNVDISYSQLDRKFYMTSKDTGSSQNISITDDSTNKFVENLFGTTVATAGTDVVVKITQPNGSSNTLIQSSNNFTVDGISYTLNSKPTEAVTFDVKGNADGTFDKIKSFIDSYNELIGKIGSQVEEKKQYTYLPLTDEQKEAMSEDEIKKWETKAKQGLFSGDSTLENMLMKMRSAFFEDVEGVGTSLFQIGLNTSSDVSERGKIIIDEEKLKEALKDNPDKVMDLFIKKSTSHEYYSRSMSSADRSERYNEEGIFHRISDIIQDNISTFRDSNGKKGTLLEIAGIKGDFTEFKNTLTNEMKERELKIQDMMKKIYEKEDRYYKQFARLEVAMNKMNSQTNWLYSQLGMSQG
ncbi:flagellar filament capping protein FliD [Clostridium sp. ZS2-4]|uniref:flagellar filament capping protein FliD n=1 Tax=Clostridium sp. ZS2-4 TaxID=2987703 RepID=UPI00227AED42|nr:flagellar filament capping protein FliD [Clostridium sp. ZS2-4]MCY6353966.1 flagellar filament capping protein FliD [Clostridium sp. ZS2-4]